MQQSLLRADSVETRDVNNVPGNLRVARRAYLCGEQPNRNLVSEFGESLYSYARRAV